MLIIISYQMLKKILLSLILAGVCLNQTCLNQNGQVVSWFLQLHNPGSVSLGYFYYDSTSTNDQFQYFSQQPDSQGTALTRTVSQLNNLNVKLMAWNDQTPYGSASSTKAHSKSLIGYDETTKQGVVIVHSMPEYPDIENNIINSTISDSQSIYGQHFLCISSNSVSTVEILTKSSIIRPNVYVNTSTIGYSMQTSNLFEYSQFTVGSTPFKVIYKNGYQNGSIFEDGLTLYLKSNIIAETWGRPIQDPWCGNETIPYTVGNAGFIQFNSSLTWKQTQDHSKWAISVSGDNSCFGDMNRMASQWKRGGIFYCLNHPNLKKAMNKLIKTPGLCV